MYCEMLITVNLANVHHHTVTNFFSCVKTFKTYSLSHLEIYNTALLASVTVTCITFLWLIYSITGNLYLFATFAHFSHSQTPAVVTGNILTFKKTLFCFYRYIYICVCFQGSSEPHHSKTFKFTWVVKLIFKDADLFFVA